MKETSSTIVKWYSMRQVAAELGMAVNTFKKHSIKAINLIRERKARILARWNVTTITCKLNTEISNVWHKFFKFIAF